MGADGCCPDCGRPWRVPLDLQALARGETLSNVPDPNPDLKGALERMIDLTQGWLDGTVCRTCNQPRLRAVP